MSTPDPQTLIRGLVAWMRMENVAPTRTRLVKFLYLSDLQHARYKSGETLTHWSWYVDSFGPLAAEALRAIDRGIDEGWLRQTILPSSDDPESGHKTIIYDIERDSMTHASQAMPPLLGAVRRWIKKYGSDTNSLLAFVYGNTEPMEAAHEGDTLDFSTAEPVQQAVATTSTLSKKDKRRVDALMQRLTAKYDAAAAERARISAGPMDDVYYDGLPREDTLRPREVVIMFPKRAR